MRKTPHNCSPQTARLAARLVDQPLQSDGIRAIVTSRAKSLTHGWRKRFGSERRRAISSPLGHAFPLPSPSTIGQLVIGSIGSYLGHFALAHRLESVPLEGII